MSVVVRRTVMIVSAAVVVTAIVIAFRPSPVLVDLGAVTRGPMVVTIDEEGVTRIKERYVVSAPLGGRLRRIELDPGDTVVADETVLAVIEPTDPTLLDARARRGAEARVRAAEAAVGQEGALVERMRRRLDFAEDEHARIEEAYAKGGASTQELEAAQLALESALQEFRARTFAREIARYELELAQSALVHTGPDAPDGGARFEIRAPINGRVLRVLQKSVAVVTPGTALLEVGDPNDLEVVIDVLSTDAVRVTPGAEVIVERWGGDGPLAATVRLVEPSAFTKVSALGVDEQRVNVVADFDSPFEERRSLGDGFRVEGRIVLWRSDDVRQVPASAVFRERSDAGGGDAGHAVFVVEDAHARLRAVEIGHRTDRAVEIRAGLEPGMTVIVHPGDTTRDGVSVRERGVD